MFEVQEFPSAQSPLLSQERQPLIGVLLHPLPALQLSVVQALPSLQLSGEPAVHVPP